LFRYRYQKNRSASGRLEFVTGTERKISFHMISRLIPVITLLKEHSHENLICFYWYCWIAKNFLNLFYIINFFKFQRFHLVFLNWIARDQSSAMRHSAGSWSCAMRYSAGSWSCVMRHSAGSTHFR
jgi:hypothetical protein